MQWRRISKRGRGRALLAGAAVAAVAVVASACGSSSSSATSSLSHAKLNSIGLPIYKQKASITWWNWVPAPYEKNLIADFNKYYPNITVKWVNTGSNTAQYAKLTTDYAAGTGFPDVVDIEYDVVGQYIAKHDLYNMKSIVQRDKAKFWKGTYSLESYGGGVYGVPQNAGWLELAYEPAVWKADHLSVPTNWAQYAHDAQVIHKDNPKEYATYFTTSSTQTQLEAGFMQAADVTPFYESKSGAWTVNIDAPKIQQIMSYWLGLVKQGVVPISTPFTPSWEHQIGQNEYVSYAMPSWCLGKTCIGAYMKKGTKFALAKLPQWPGDNSNGNWGGEGMSVSAKSKYPEAATLFAMFSTLAPKGEADNITSGQIPANNNNRSIKGFNVNIPYFTTKDPYAVYQSVSNLPQSTTFLFGPWWTELSDLFQAEMNQVEAGKISVGAGLAKVQSQLLSYVKGAGYTNTKACKPDSTNDTASC